MENDHQVNLITETNKVVDTEGHDGKTKEMAVTADFASVKSDKNLSGAT